MYKKTFLVFLTIALTIMLFSGCSFFNGSGVRISEKDISAFNSVSVSTSLSKIEFIESGKYGMEIFVPQGYSPEWDLTNGRLTINETMNDIDINIGFVSNEYYVKVYYPAGTAFDGIDLRTSSGRIQLPKLEVTDLKLRTSSGAINANTANCENASLDTSSGDIVFSGNEGRVNMTTSSGAVRSEIENCEAVNITTSSGEITLTGKGDLATALSANTSSGSIDITGVAWRDATTKTSSGSTTISGKLLGNTSVVSSSGSVNINVNGSPSEYGYTLTPGSGSIHWNGDRMESPARSSGSFENNIDVKTSSGSIRVDFK